MIQYINDRQTIEFRIYIEDPARKFKFKAHYSIYI